MIWRNIKLVLSLHVIQWHSRGCLKLTFLKITITFRFNTTTVCPGIGIPIIITMQSWEPIFITWIPKLISVRFYNKTTPAYLVWPTSRLLMICCGRMESSYHEASYWPSLFGVPRWIDSLNQAKTYLALIHHTLRRLIINFNVILAFAISFKGCNKSLKCLARISKSIQNFTRWGRVTHICVVNLAIIGSVNGLSPTRRQAII